MNENKRIRGIFRGKLIKEVDDISELYDEGYYNGDVYPKYTMESERRINSRRITFVKQFWKGSAKILDVGCAKGFFLLHAKKAGLDPYGVDISSYAINQGKALFGESLVCGNVEEHIPFSDEFFDVITCWDVIEHLRNPSQFLKNLSRKLKKDGLIFVETCNYYSMSRRIMKENWIFYGEGYHRTPDITIGIMENWFRNASLTMVKAFTDYIYVPLSDQLIEIFHITPPVAERCLYPVRALEYGISKLLGNISPNFGDLLFCVAKKL